MKDECYNCFPLGSFRNITSCRPLSNIIRIESVLTSQSCYLAILNHLNWESVCLLGSFSWYHVWVECQGEASGGSGVTLLCFSTVWGPNSEWEEREPFGLQRPHGSNGQADLGLVYVVWRLWFQIYVKMVSFIYAGMERGPTLHTHWCRFSVHPSVKVIRILEAD